VNFFHVKEFRKKIQKCASEVWIRDLILIKWVSYLTMVRWLKKNV
jgi:hypothetical protein